MIVEILITSVLIITAVYLLWKSIRKKSAGECGCSECSNKCPGCSKSSGN